MNTNTVLLIELLSLVQEPSAYRMEICVTKDEEKAVYFIEIDVMTYNQLSSAKPSESERIRLSLYSKPDPYRHIHNSSYSRIQKDSIEQVPFECSAAYAETIEQLRKGIVPATAFTPSDAAPGSTEASGGSQQAEARRSRNAFANALAFGDRGTFGSIALRFAIFVLIITLISIGLDGKLFNDQDDSRFRVVAAGSEEDAAGEPAESDLMSRLPFIGSVQAMGYAVPAFGETTTNQVQVEHAVLTAETKETSTNSEAPELTEEPETSYESIALSGDKPLYSLPKGYVALTFDDGPSAYTKQIVDILKQNDAAATFLFIGNNAKRFPDSVAYASEHDMAIGNHSYRHSNLTGLTAEKALDELNLTNERLEETTGKPVTIFRPPYGAINDGLVKLIEGQQMKVLMWNRDPEDWNVKNSEDIVDYFKNTDPSGGIYVLHEKKMTVEALPAILDYLKEKELKFTVFE
ncbi:polysaccharide deacetylase family protein [Paenibacillus sp. NPDC058071]|uniref:polysaccharide deacetylase family protein n=1 Tax=Paenibacillus sp. NPDC058071 TaxID=3346326 RepID=UPI0036DBB86C